MSSNTNELATAELVDRGLEALKSREYRQALTLWEEVHRRHPDHPRATRLVQELRAWLERRNTVKPRTSKVDVDRETTGTSNTSGDLQRVERRIRDLEQRLESTVRRKSELLDEINDLHAHYREREEELQRASEKRALRLSDELSELRESDGRLRQQHLETSQELVRFERERDDAQLRANSLLDDLDKERRTNEDLRARIEDLREEQSDLRTELASFNRDEIDELREIADTIEPLHHELRDAHETIAKLEDSHARLQANLADSQDHSRSVESKYDERHEQLLAQFQDSSAKYRVAAEELDEARERVESSRRANEEFTQALDTAEASRRGLLESLEASKADNAKLTSRFHALESRNTILVEKLEAVEARLAALVPLDDESGERSQQVSDSFDISGLLEDEDVLRAELKAAEKTKPGDDLVKVDGWKDADNQIFDVDDGNTDFSDSLDSPADDLPDEVASHEETLLSLLNDEADIEVGGLSRRPVEKSEPSNKELRETDPFDELEDSELREIEPHDEDLSELLGSSMDTLFDDDDDDDFVDLDSPSAQSYLGSNEEDFELVDPNEHPGYSGEFEALLMSTPDLASTGDSDDAQLAADRFRSLTNQPDAVVNAVKDASADESDLTPLSAFVLSRIDQQVRIGELIDTMGLPASKTISCLEELEHRGFIRVEA